MNDLGGEGGENLIKCYWSSIATSGNLVFNKPLNSMRSIIIPIITVLILLCTSCSNPEPAIQKNATIALQQQNKTIIQRYFGEVWNQGKLAVLDELLDPAYINHTPSVPNPPVGPEGLKPIVAAIRKAFPDLHYELQDLIVNDSMAVVRVIMSGTQTGSLFGLPPTGKKVAVNQINIEKIRQGKIVEHWRVTDELNSMCDFWQSYRSRTPAT